MSSTKIPAVKKADEAAAVPTTVQTATPPDTQNDDVPAAPIPAKETTAPADTAAGIPAASQSKPATFATASTEEASKTEEADAAKNRVEVRGAFYCAASATAAVFAPSSDTRLPEKAQPAPASPSTIAERRRQELNALAAKLEAHRAARLGQADTAKPAAKGVVASSSSRQGMQPSTTAASAPAPRQSGAAWNLRKRAREASESDTEDDIPAPIRKRTNSISPSPFWRPDEQRGAPARTQAAASTTAEAKANNGLKIYIKSPARASAQRTSVSSPSPSPSPRPNEHSRPGARLLAETTIPAPRGPHPPATDDPCHDHISEADVVTLYEAYQREAARMKSLVREYRAAQEQVKTDIDEARAELAKLDEGLAVAVRKRKELKAKADVLMEVVEKSRMRDEDSEEGEG